MPKNNSNGESQIEEMLKNQLQIYLGYDDAFIEELLLDPYLGRKELVNRIADMDLMF